MTRKEIVFASIAAVAALVGIASNWQWDRPAMKSEVLDGDEAVIQSRSPVLDAAEQDIEDRAYRNRVFKSKLEREVEEQGGVPTESQQRTLHDIDKAYEAAIENLREIRAQKKQ